MLSVYSLITMLYVHLHYLKSKVDYNVVFLSHSCMCPTVLQVDVFQTNDLFEKRDLGAVTNTMFALDRAVGPFKGSAPKIIS